MARRPINDLGIPSGLENVLGDILNRQIGRLNGGRLGSGGRGGGRGGGLDDALGQLFALQDRRMKIGNVFGSLSGLASALGGSSRAVKGRF